MLGTCSKTKPWPYQTLDCSFHRYIMDGVFLSLVWLDGAVGGKGAPHPQGISGDRLHLILQLLQRRELWPGP